ncbi:hypothetical protein FPV67DRAFT_1457004 [Lyophyllum atratum]|nr:hypothetical protein FPV67DRAFT_1457004 [Lyophyllum atratum]
MAKADAARFLPATTMSIPVLNLLRKTARALTALQPLPEDASPAAKEAHLVLLRKASKYAYMTGVVVDDLCSAENIDLNLSDTISDDDLVEDETGGSPATVAAAHSAGRNSQPDAREVSPVQMQGPHGASAGSSPAPEKALDDDAEMDVVPEKKSNDEVVNEFASLKPENNQFQVAQERFVLITRFCTSRECLGFGLRHRILNWNLSKGLRNQEDEALARLFTAYHEAADEELTLWFGSLRDQSAKWGGFIERLGLSEVSQERRKRLLDMDKFIDQSAAGDKVLLWVEYVVDTAIAVKWAEDWNAAETNDAWKRSYRDELFEILCQAKIRTLRARFAGKKLEKEEEKERKRFRRQHEKLVTSRNITYKLYRMFGAAVVSEPIFKPVNAAGRPTGRSRSFPATYQLFLSRFRDHLEEVGILEDMVEQSRGNIADFNAAYEEYITLGHDTSADLIVRVVGYVASDDIADWLDIFFYTHKPDLTLGFGNTGIEGDGDGASNA